MEFNIKQKNDLFLKSLIESDFLFLDQKNKKSLRSIKKVSKGQVSSSLTFLDPLETVKTLKQSIRLLQFLKKQKSGFLHVVVENKQHLDLANAFFKSYPLCLPHLVGENIPTKSINSSVSQLLLLLNFPLNNKETFLIEQLQVKFLRRSGDSSKMNLNVLINVMRLFLFKLRMLKI